MNVLDALIRNLSRMPGIGAKSASRLAYFLLEADKEYMHSLSQQIASLQDKIKPCSVCGNYTEEELCSICRDSRRDHNLVCAVEHPQDVANIESTNEYNGLFHVLGGAISPLDGVGPGDLNIASLIHRVKAEGIDEVIIATNPTVEGDTTALYLVKLLGATGVKITRLASGLPVGGDLEYADRLTLARSIRGRTQFTL